MKPLRFRGTTTVMARARGTPDMRPRAARAEPLHVISSSGSCGTISAAFEGAKCQIVSTSQRTCIQSQAAVKIAPPLKVTDKKLQTEPPRSPRGAALFGRSRTVRWVEREGLHHVPVASQWPRHMIN
jgi:hypothetical protein